MNSVGIIMGSDSDLRVMKQAIEVLRELEIDYLWKGKELSSRCYIKGTKNKIISIDKNYFRPLEVDTLLGNSRKARRELKWKPKYNVKSMIKEMVYEELNSLKNDKKN